MPTPLERTIHIDREKINPETGEFPLVLATQGEATDGNILNIRGADIPERMPLQLAHANSPTQTLGSIFSVRQGQKKGLPVLRATGKIDLEGEGALADIRRDLAHMINEGHVTGMSLRAEGTKVTPRTELPRDHFAFVERDEPNLLKRFGAFFERFTGLEGSIVALPADTGAIIGRAQETEGPIREFWESFLPEEGDSPETQETPQIGVIEYNTTDIEDVRSLERFLGEMPGISRKEAKRLASIKTETAQPSRDAKEETPEITVEEISMEEIREIFRGEITNTLSDIRNEVSDLMSETLGKVRVH